MYYVYMLRCNDNSIYTGITTDVERRFNEHCRKDEKSAKYTKSRAAERIESVWKTENKALASKLEYHIKTLNKAKKEALITSHNLEKFLNEKIDSSKYVHIDKNF